MTFTSRKRVSCKHDMRVENRREGRVVSLTIWSKLIAKQIPKFGKVLEMKETGTELTDTRDDWVLGALIAPGTLITWPAHHALFARTLTVHLIANFSRRPVRVTGARWGTKDEPVKRQREPKHKYWLVEHTSRQTDRLRKKDRQTDRL